MKALLASLFLLITVEAFAFEGRLLLDGTRPLSNAQVSVAGRSGGVRTDAEGRFRIEPDPPLPATLIVVGPRGEIYDPVEISSANGVQQITLQALVSEAITVSSGTAPNILSPPAAATAVIGRDELEQRKPEHLVEALERTAGIEKRGEGPAAVPVVRGLAGGRTLILIDDGRVTAERRAGASATFLNPFILGSVEVARGPGSVSYGSDAFGGVIHARPRDPVPGQRQLRYELSTSTGASDLTSAGIEWSQDLFGGAILGAVYGRTADDGEAGGGERIFNSAYDDRGATVRFARSFTNSTLRLGLAADRGRDISAPSADAREQRTYYPFEDSTRLTASWDAMDLAGFDSVELRGALGEYDIATNRERLPATGVTRQISNSTVSADDASLRLTGFRSAGRLGRLSTGVDFTTRFNLRATGFVQRYDDVGEPAERSEEISVEDAQKRDAGLFVTLDSAPAEKWTTSIGLRGDSIESRNRGGFVGDRQIDDTALSGHAAVTWTPFRNLTASMQVASGYREPTISDRYFRGVSGRGFVIGNPDLEAERSLQYDGSVRWQHGRTSAALYVYDYEITDLVERYREGSDFRFRNRGEANVKGVEAELTLPLVEALSLQAAATIARGEAEGGTPLDDISGPNGNLALRYARGRGYAFAHGFWFGEDDRPGPVEVVRPSHTTVDLGGGFRFSRAIELRMHARNIFDERYAGSADDNAALAPGRSFTIFLGGVL